MCAAPVHDVTLRYELIASDRAQIEHAVTATKFFREDEVPVAMELVDDRLANKEESDYEFVVALRDGKVAGYACYGLIACSVHSYDLYWIVVAPEIQRGGIGRKLLAAVEERVAAIGGKRVYAETSSKPLYEPTRKFYLSCGYKIDAVLEEFYAPEDSKVIFVKALAPAATEAAKTAE